MSFGSRFWNPDVAQDVTVEETVSGWETSTISASCLEPNRLAPFFRGGVIVQLKLVSIGPPVDQNFLEFASAFNGAGRVTAFDEDAVGTLPRDPVFEGRTFSAFIVVEGLGQPPCEASDDATSTSTTASTTDGAGDFTDTSGPPQPPVNKIGEASDESGDAGDPRYDITELTHEEQDGSHSLSL